MCAFYVVLGGIAWMCAIVTFILTSFLRPLGSVLYLVSIRKIADMSCFCGLSRRGGFCLGSAGAFYVGLDRIKRMDVIKTLMTNVFY